jgi:hypothetical protein
MCNYVKFEQLCDVFPLSLLSDKNRRLRNVIPEDPVFGAFVAILQANSEAPKSVFGGSDFAWTATSCF